MANLLLAHGHSLHKLLRTRGWTRRFVTRQSKEVSIATMPTVNDGPSKCPARCFASFAFVASRQKHARASFKAHARLAEASQRSRPSFHWRVEKGSEVVRGGRTHKRDEKATRSETHSGSSSSRPGRTRLPASPCPCSSSCAEGKPHGTSTVRQLRPSAFSRSRVGTAM